MTEPVRAWAVVLEDDDTWGFFHSLEAAQRICEALTRDEKPARVVELIEAAPLRSDLARVAELERALDEARMVRDQEAKMREDVLERICAHAGPPADWRTQSIATILEILVERVTAEREDRRCDGCDLWAGTHAPMLHPCRAGHNHGRDPISWHCADWTPRKEKP